MRVARVALAEELRVVTLRVAALVHVKRPQRVVGVPVRALAILSEGPPGAGRVAGNTAQEVARNKRRWDLLLRISMAIHPSRRGRRTGPDARPRGRL